MYCCLLMQIVWLSRYRSHPYSHPNVVIPVFGDGFSSDLLADAGAALDGGDDLTPSILESSAARRMDDKVSRRPAAMRKNKDFILSLT